ncbi:MAG TPA: DNA-processing protein DprA [Solirubrobacteraceae bacterium]|nr:DNA-processing protein DprA [Solirubrobacteraceae bacterium]
MSTRATGAASTSVAACGDCLRRSWLLAALSGHIERASRRRRDLSNLFALSDEALIAALGGRMAPRLRAAHGAFEPAAARNRAACAGQGAICRHDERFPPSVAETPDGPAALYVAGDLERLLALVAEPAVAVVGARRASAYALEVARALGRDLSAAGITVVSGMALGVDSAAHAGALAGGARTIAVLAGSAGVAYPRSKRRLHEQLVGAGAVVSEMPPGSVALRWSFPARNRVIAALARATVVVEAADRSGSLITADFARELGRDVGAVPGLVTSGRAQGTNALLFDGAHFVRDAGDVLDLLFGAGARERTARRDGSELDARLRRVLAAVEDGGGPLSALATTPEDARAAMAALAELELLGYVRRGPAGSYARVA